MLAEKHKLGDRSVIRKGVWPPEEWFLTLHCHRISMVQPAESRKGFNPALSLRCDKLVLQAVYLRLQGLDLLLLIIELGFAGGVFDVIGLGIVSVPVQIELAL